MIIVGSSMIDIKLLIGMSMTDMAFGDIINSVVNAIASIVRKFISLLSLFRTILIQLIPQSALH